MSDENDYRPGDSEVPILRKILNRLGQLVGFGPPEVSTGPVTLEVSDIEIGAVELKDGSTDTRAKIRTDDPQPSDEGLVVRNIPSGTQDVEVTNFPATQDVQVTNFPVTQPVSGPLTDAQLRASPVPVSGPLTDAQLRAAAVPVSAASLPLPSGAATEATLATRLSESAFQARINSLGQKTSANSTPVVLASDQSAVPVSAAALPLPTGAATEATLATRLSESAFQARINTLGQKTSPNSTPVVIASDQSQIQIVSNGGFYPVTGTVAVDWRQISGSAPKRYSIVSILTGAVAANTNIMGLRKLLANNDAYIIRIRVHVYHAAAGVATVLAWRRATTVAGGALTAAADIPKLDTSAANATLEVRTGAVTGTKAAQYIITHPAHTTAAPAAGVGSPWIDEWVPPDKGGRIRLTGDEGLILDQQTAGDVDNRYHILVEWEEEI